MQILQKAAGDFRKRPALFDKIAQPIIAVDLQGDIVQIGKGAVDRPRFQQHSDANAAAIKQKRVINTAVGLTDAFAAFDKGKGPAVVCIMGHLFRAVIENALLPELL